MNIYSIQNRTLDNHKNLNYKKPSFKGVIVSEKYFGPFEKYASNKLLTEEKETLNWLKNWTLNLRQGKGIHPSYTYCILNRVSATDPTREYFNKKDGYNSKTIPKYNEMVETLGKQADNLDILILPPPLCEDDDYLSTAYAVPALGIYGRDRDCNCYNENRIKIQNTDCKNGFRWLVFPSYRLLGKIIINIYEKLDGYLQEGLKSKTDKIIIPTPSKEHSSMFEQIIGENDRFASFAEYGIKMIFNPIKKSESSFCYSHSDWWGDLLEQERRESERFASIRRHAFNEEMEDD